jgi:hypothetical protein
MEECLAGGDIRGILTIWQYFLIINDLDSKLNNLGTVNLWVKNKGEK